MEEIDKYEPTNEEKKNGWTKETLRSYHESRNRQQMKFIHSKKVSMPGEQNHKYNPHKWRP
jgi:hypothetical protein|tara:strand:- start:184 stop:366 length:183 start_codon:yes stop_codon:yes gene_type:complete